MNDVDFDDNELDEWINVYNEKLKKGGLVPKQNDIIT